MAATNTDIQRLNDLASSWRDAIASTEPELTAQLFEDPAVRDAIVELRAALAAQRELTDLLEVEALDRFRSNKQLESLATSSLKDAAGVVRKAQTALATVVRIARTTREQAAVATTVSRVNALLGKSATDLED